MPYRFPRSSVKFQGHTVQKITDFDPNWAFPDYRPVAAFKSLRFALFLVYMLLLFFLFIQLTVDLQKVPIASLQRKHHGKPMKEVLIRILINTLRPKQNGRHLADDTFKRISLNENVRISIKISLNFVPYGPINNILALVQIVAWRRSGDKPLSEPMLVRLPTHICITRPQ